MYICLNKLSVFLTESLIYEYLKKNTILACETELKIISVVLITLHLRYRKIYMAIFSFIYKKYWVIKICNYFFAKCICIWIFSEVWPLGTEMYYCKTVLSSNICWLGISLPFLKYITKLSSLHYKSVLTAEIASVTNLCINKPLEMLLCFKPGFHAYMAGADHRTIVWVLPLCRILSWHQHFREMLWLPLLGDGMLK